MYEQRRTYEPDRIAQQAVTYARDHLFERFRRAGPARAFGSGAQSRQWGETTYAHIRQEFAQRAARGRVPHSRSRTAVHPPPAMLRMERDIITRMQEGNQRGMSDPMLVSPQIRIATEDRHPELNASQRQVVDQLFLSREKIVGLDGVAGAGKTTALAVIREGAAAQGYKVEGFAPHVSRGAKAGRCRHGNIHAAKNILHAASSRIPETAACMCSMNLRLRPPSRCTNL